MYLQKILTARRVDGVVVWRRGLWLVRSAAFPGNSEKRHAGKKLVKSARLTFENSVGAFPHLEPSVGEPGWILAWTWATFVVQHQWAPFSNNSHSNWLLSFTVWPEEDQGLQHETPRNNTETQSSSPLVAWQWIQSTWTWTLKAQWCRVGHAVATLPPCSATPFTTHCK